jgi:RNA polymerase sigma-70 factor (ECF subfamily)
MTSILAPTQPAVDRSFERLYRAHVQDVYRYSLMVLRNTADAEDVAQTTFMKAYRAILRGERPRHPRRWLITIAHNTCRTRFRDEKRRPQEVELDEQFTEAVASPEDDDVDVQELVKALGALSFNQRAALVMRELEGRSYDEIAELLEISGSAVETLLFRARRALREQLEGALTCGEAERALSLQLDGRLDSSERGRLRAHLRECGECASLARRQRARRAALRSLGPLPLPASLASWGGAAAGTGIAAKVAALLAAGVVVAGSAQDRARGVVEGPAREPVTAAVATRTPVAPAGIRADIAPAGLPDTSRRQQLRSRSSLVHEPMLHEPPAAKKTPAQAPPAPAAAPTPVVSTPEPTQVIVTVPQVQVPPVVPEVALPPTPPVTVPIELPPLPVELPPPPTLP